MKPSTLLILPFLGIFLTSAAPLAAQTREAAIVESATQVLCEVMRIPGRRIPEALLADAQGIAIIPDLLKGGFVVGVRHGRGVVLVRDENGAWRPPVFASLTGGSVGWQIGLQATDIVLVFRTRSSVQGLLGGKFTLGADAAAAAGPVGREAAVATDATLKAEIYTYSRSRGLFAGVSLDGSVVQIDGTATSVYYAGTNILTPGAGPAGPLPPSAGRLIDLLNRVSAPQVVVAPAALVPAASPNARPTPAAADGQPIQRQLAESAQRLHAVLDDNWKAYFRLPPELLSGQSRASAEAVWQSLQRFDIVARDPRYHALVAKPEFQSTYQLLQQHYAQQALRNVPAPAEPTLAK